MIPTEAPAPAVEAYARTIRVMPASRQPSRMAGFKAGWAAAAEAGGRSLVQQDLEVFATKIEEEFSYNQRTMINGFKDGWSEARAAAQ